MLKQVKNFKFHWCKFSHEKEKKYIEQKLAKCSKTLGIVNNTLKPNLVQKSSKTKVYSALAIHILLYRHEILIFRQKDKNGLTTIEKKFLRITAGYPIFVGPR